MTAVRRLPGGRSATIRSRSLVSAKTRAHSADGDAVVADAVAPDVVVPDACWLPRRSNSTAVGSLFAGVPASPAVSVSYNVRSSFRVLEH